MKIIVVDLTSMEDFGDRLEWPATKLVRGDGLVVKLENELEDISLWQTQSLPPQLVESRSADNTPMKTPQFFDEKFEIHKHYIAKKLGDGLLTLTLTGNDASIKQIVMPIDVVTSLEISKPL